jgi:hypothetical protein
MSRKNKTLDFTGAHEKIKDHWPKFVKFKLSDEAKKRSKTNTANASLKTYHHITGPGGYKSNMPKWEAVEAELINKGINIETTDWAERAKQWFYGVAGKLELETGKCIMAKEHLKKHVEDLVAAHKDMREGRFHPERENDEHDG